jgi:hypothetical protein
MCHSYFFDVNLRTDCKQAQGNLQRSGLLDLDLSPGYSLFLNF